MVQDILGVFQPQIAIEIAIQIVLSLALGGIVGWDRERRHMPAGVRTFMLVSVGSCIFTILSYRAFENADRSRVAAQVVSGIGFLGAGVMIQRKGTVYGLTSAAGVWAVAAVGMAVGTGKYFVAVCGALSIYVILAFLRRWFKADMVRSTQHTLHTSLSQVRDEILLMKNLADRALRTAIRAVVQDDHLLAQQVIEQDAEINSLRYQVEEACLEILREHSPKKLQLRTVLAATHVATNLERVGDYAKEIAQIRLQMGHESLLPLMDMIQDMGDQVRTLLGSVVDAFGDDDIAAAEKIVEQVAEVDQIYEQIVERVTSRMTDKKTKHFERGANLLTVAYHLKRTGERVTNIAERIIFVRTGALAELDRDDQIQSILES